MRHILSGAVALTMLAAPAAEARELAAVTRIDAEHAELERADTGPVSIWRSTDTKLDASDVLVAKNTHAQKLAVELPVSQRDYLILEGKNGVVVVAERVLPLEQGSNFRDIGGYVTRDGQVVRWGKVFRSGAQPMLTPADLTLVDQLHLGTVVDLRSIEEREINPDTIDDREGALFVSNDYSMRALMGPMMARKGEHIYEGMEKLLAPQYRSLYRQIIAEGEGYDGGAVIYHCSAGQDRTGVATALLYDLLGVDRETILKDYHLSTELRHPHWEMPKLDPADFPNNPIVAHYAKAYADKDARAEHLFTPSGQSHLAQFFTYLDATYGGSAGYMKQVLGFADEDIARLRAVMLRPAQ
ncbi:tyrosine-protein phosphatase [Novosphingobium album (ex Hu et al. 2023)]|uniref:Tyrosine-protein phosphatase n=1 Tax=Novosphingobium album (ex Hu et al. 2023) TaxID=2930093 RepID=A0ABT0AZE4_9SPHN|nr:tyrosine-protein phosphatase [Novosphingobium album (ex Hu et al. 2023)]MCJ2178145.1 tyrosine-protein phosphatase [Novosphingobium album (ex Hu et al. 2023)]